MKKTLEIPYFKPVFKFICEISET